MITKTVLALVLSIVFCFNTSHSFADPYIGTSVFTMDTDVGDFRGVDLNAGYRAGELVEVRLHYMLGAQDESYQGVSLSLEKKYGVDLIINLPLSDTFIPFVSVGNTWMEAKGTYQGYSASAKDDHATYGFGVRVAAREAVSFTAEYKRIDDIDLFALGITANF